MSAANTSEGEQKHTLPRHETRVGGTATNMDKGGQNHTPPREEDTKRV